MIVLGIDPGLSGGLAIVAGAPGRLRLIEVIDIPTHGEGAKRRVHVAAALDFIQRHNPDRAFIERAQAMPDQGSSSGFIYGRAVGALEACAEGLGIRLDVIESSAWKKAHGLFGRDAHGEKLTTTQVKENSRQRAIQIFPSARGLDRKKDHNRGEAALIAAYGAGLP